MLFTIILEFEGTTSVSQFSGRNVDEAYQSWFQGLKDHDRYGLNPKQAERLEAELLLDRIRTPTLLSSMENVWCTTALVGKSFALLNFVATLSTTSNSD